MLDKQKDVTVQLNVAEARANIGQILEDVYYNDRRYIIARRGRPYVIMTKVNKSLEKGKKSKSLIKIAQDVNKLQRKSPKTIQQVMDEARTRTLAPLAELRITGGPKDLSSKLDKYIYE